MAAAATLPQASIEAILGPRRSFGAALVEATCKNTSGPGDVTKLGLNIVKGLRMTGLYQAPVAERAFSDAYNATTLLGAPGQVVRLASDLKKGKVAKSVQGTAGLVYTGADLAKSYGNLSASAAATAATVTVVSGCVSQAVGLGLACTELAKKTSVLSDTGKGKLGVPGTKVYASVAKAEKKERTKAALFAIVKHVSRLALGVFSGLALFFSMIVPSAIFLGVSTLGVVAAIFASTFAVRQARHTDNREVLERLAKA